MKYIVQVGREPALAVSEILTLAETYNKSLSLSWIHDSLVCFEGDDGCDFMTTARLGGALKVIEPLDYVDDVRTAILEQLLHIDGKITFGISSWVDDDALAPQYLSPAIKSELRERDRSARFLLPKKKQLDAAAIIHSDILRSGGEFHIIPEGDKILLGRSTSVHDIDAWSKRDFEKPARDAKRGMLPPKLARIMVNLSGISQGTILDPFCGTGTVSMEAALLGFDGIASDADPEAITATQKNIDWLQTVIPAQAESHIDILQHDARDIARRIKKDVDAIVTEPFLGNPKKLTHEQRIEHAQVIGELYVDALKNWTTFLRKGSRIVMVIPLYRTKKGLVSIPIHDQFKKIGYDVIEPPTTTLSLDDQLSPSSNLLYGRDDQRVLREIILLKRT